MDVSDLKGLFGEVKKRMDAHTEFVRKELAGVRTGRAKARGSSTRGPSWNAYVNCGFNCPVANMEVRSRAFSAKAA